MMKLVPLFWLLLLAPSAGADDDGEQYYNSFSVCSDSAVVVNQISILCDSPGTYYYGSNKYRNSAKCQGGDKAKLQVELELIEQLEDDVAYLTLYVEGYGTVESKQIYYMQEMCSTSLTSEGGSSLCANGSLEVGKYYFKDQFYWGDQEDSYEYSFKPKVVVGISSDPGKNQYDLGGANTNKCDGNTFLNWTTGVRRSAANTLTTFIITFGILASAILCIMAFGFFVVRTADAPPEETKKSLKEELIDPENQEKGVMEQHRIAIMVGKNQDLVEF